ncbi:sensor histidine kinase [Parapedobacter deserti]|uniref:Sensor histidine kinase n=1 Tax=Parapedobacter deserti TaxID=1912957 RepID=A0ABV7JSP5_9SPHI
MKLNRIEIISATGIYLFILILFFSNQNQHGGLRMAASWMGYASVVYCAYLVFTQWISPVFFRRKRIEAGIAITLLLFFGVWIGLSTCAWMMAHYGRRDNFWQYLPQGLSLGGALLVLLLLFVYEGFKRLIRYSQNKRKTVATRIAQESLVILGGGTLIFLMLLTLKQDLAALWLSAVPYAYLLYALNIYWLLPYCERKGLVYIPLAIGLSFVVFIPFGCLFIAIANLNSNVYFVEWFCLTLIVLPLSYYLYHRQKGRLAQLFTLQTELGQASAGLHFLRSQINPHFLFNILNTLYGTALQEKAERTSSGIQKLGDMMRFMLHENNQDRILLAREIEYLRNYIDLQQLRTASSSVITVDSDIKDVIEGSYIAPMLLIPFVENAFKHGISLQDKSWIKISLYESDDKLYFDVYNSIHRKKEDDPERRHTGIGLENVKQRLAMLYAGTHELIVRESKQEFFVHLTVHLS